MRNPEYKVGQVIWRTRDAAVRFKPFCQHNHGNYHGGQVIALTNDGSDQEASVDRGAFFPSKLPAWCYE